MPELLLNKVNVKMDILWKRDKKWVEQRHPKATVKTPKLRKLFTNKVTQRQLCGLGLNISKAMRKHQDGLKNLPIKWQPRLENTINLLHDLKRYHPSVFYVKLYSDLSLLSGYSNYVSCKIIILINIENISGIIFFAILPSPLLVAIKRSGTRPVLGIVEPVFLCSEGLLRGIQVHSLLVLDLNQIV